MRFGDPKDLADELMENLEVDTKGRHKKLWIGLICGVCIVVAIGFLAYKMFIPTTILLKDSTYFDYDAANRRYLMSMYNSSKKTREATIDENTGQQLGFENVIVAFADITTYPYPGGNLDKNGNDKGDPGYQKVDLSYGGIGYYFSNGKVEPIRWFKGGASERLRFTDMDENPLELNCGKTYIGFVDLDEYDNFDYAGPDEEIVETIDPNAGGNEVEVEVE